MHFKVEDGSRKQIVPRLKSHAPLPEIQAHALTKFAYKHMRFYVREYGSSICEPHQRNPKSVEEIGLYSDLED